MIWHQGQSCQIRISLSTSMTLLNLKPRSTLCTICCGCCGDYDYLEQGVPGTSAEGVASGTNSQTRHTVLVSYKRARKRER